MVHFFNHLFQNKIYVLLAVLFSAIVSPSLSQVGFNNPNPDSSALIDMKSNDKGLLIPRMTTTDRDLMTSGGKKVAHSLLVFDTDQNMFFVFDTIANPDRWLALNPWASQGTDDPDITTVTTGNVGIGTTTAPTEKLEVNGNVKVSGTVNATNYALNTNGNGPVPAGGIIMWSGSIASIPTGWALCDGTNGTPDLRQRFITGAGDNPVVPGTGYTPGSTGGADQVTLTATQSGLPAHSHTVNDPGHTHSISQSNWGDLIAIGGYDAHSDNGSGNTSFDNVNAVSLTAANATTNITINNSAAQNAAAPHENRPPYYALAFIMKLP